MAIIAIFAMLFFGRVGYYFIVQRPEIESGYKIATFVLLLILFFLMGANFQLHFFTPLK